MILGGTISAAAHPPLPPLMNRNNDEVDLASQVQPAARVTETLARIRTSIIPRLTHRYKDPCNGKELLLVLITTV